MLYITFNYFLQFFFFCNFELFLRGKCYHGSCTQIINNDFQAKYNQIILQCRYRYGRSLFIIMPVIFHDDHGHTYFVLSIKKKR